MFVGFVVEDCVVLYVFLLLMYLMLEFLLDVNKFKYGVVEVVVKKVFRMVSRLFGV